MPSTITTLLAAEGGKFFSIDEACALIVLVNTAAVNPEWLKTIEQVAPGMAEKILYLASR